MLTLVFAQKVEHDFFHDLQLGFSSLVNLYPDTTLKCTVQVGWNQQFDFFQLQLVGFFALTHGGAALPGPGSEVLNRQKYPGPTLR